VPEVRGRACSRAEGSPGRSPGHGFDLHHAVGAGEAHHRDATGGGALLDLRLIFPRRDVAQASGRALQAPAGRWPTRCSAGVAPRRLALTPRAKKRCRTRRARPSRPLRQVCMMSRIWRSLDTPGINLVTRQYRPDAVAGDHGARTAKGRDPRRGCYGALWTLGSPRWRRASTSIRHPQALRHEPPATRGRRDDDGRTRGGRQSQALPPNGNVASRRRRASRSPGHPVLGGRGQCPCRAARAPGGFVQPTIYTGVRNRARRPRRGTTARNAGQPAIGPPSYLLDNWRLDAHLPPGLRNRSVPVPRDAERIVAGV